MSKQSGQWPVVSGQSPSGRCCGGLRAGHRPLATAFSLVELLIVVAIIVLVIALAVPAFNLINGTRSVDAAENLVSVMLGRARTEAIGVQKIRGVMFYVDPMTQRVNMTIVQAADPPNPPNPPQPGQIVFDVDVYLDLADGGDTIPLPQGIGAQVVDDPTDPITGVLNDRFIGYNRKHSGSTPLPDKSPQYGGVILFDGRGQLVCKSYAFKCRPSIVPAPYFTPMGQLLYQPIEAELATAPENIMPSAIGNMGTQRSAVGLLLFDLENFAGIDDNKLDDPQIAGGTYATTEQAEEAWLDQNAVPLLINRYNGTLIKGE